MVGAIAVTAGICATLFVGSWGHQADDRQAPASFTDCDDCPPMLALPAGTYHMGRQIRLRDRLIDALPVLELPPLRTVDVAPFALGRTEVTIGQWELCIRDGACRRLPTRRDDTDTSHPVTNVSWYDAQDYVRWLSSKTGHAYRLPSEAEWEYAARAGTRTPFPWGRTADRNYANFGKEQCPPCFGEVGGRDQWHMTAPVGQFPPNAFGLNDMHGNVYEWTEDCFTGLAYEKVSAIPVVVEPCTARVMRGGGWHNDARRIQSDYRAHNQPQHSDEKIGFRVARPLH